MQENSVVLYTRISETRPPAPSGELNARQEPTFNVRATGISTCGIIKDPNSSSFSNETREVDLVFTSITTRQLEFISRGSELFIQGASCISYKTPVIYPKALFAAMSVSGNATDSEDIINWLGNKLNAIPGDKTYEALTALLPKERRITIIRVKPGQWSLKASPQQIASGNKMYEGIEEQFGGI